MSKLFGTDGIRGVANVAPMTVEIAMQVGRALAFLIKKGERRHRIVIGKDTRRSCYMLENALAAGICSMGVDVLLVGPLPTPGISFITTSMRADAGVVISASHNPFQDNGIKLFGKDGFKLPDEIEQAIEDLVVSQKIDQIRPVASEVGKAFRIADAGGRYIVFLKSTFPQEYSLDGIKIVLDCANGATYNVAPCVFEELGAEVVSLAVTPDGENINKACGALYPERMAEKVRETGAMLGLAFDGDGDRLIVCDEHGAIVDGDHIMAICAQDLLQRKKLRKNTLVSTVMSNMGLEAAVAKMGGRMVRTPVGDRAVVDCMRTNGFSFGGEQSGHLVFFDHITTGDGILAGLQLLGVMCRTNRSLAELSMVMESFPQVLKNVRMSGKKDTALIPGFHEKIVLFEKELGRTGRILVRPSGTEPLLRVMVEGRDEEQIHRMADELCDVIRAAQ